MKKTLRLLAIVGLLAMSQLAYLAPSNASDLCMSPPNDQFSGATWTPNAGAGYYAAAIRAPVLLRQGASICTDFENLDSVGEWIGIENTAETQIAQTGFVRIITDWNTYQAQYCRFWAIGIGNVHAYHCGGDSGGDTDYFEIQAQGSGQHYYYSIFDCGLTGGYDNCVLKNAAESVDFDAYGLSMGEANYACGDQFNGGPTSRAQFGNSDYPIKGQSAVGSAWSTHQWDVQHNNNCGHYENSVTDTVIQTWDNRNS